MHTRLISLITIFLMFSLVPNCVVAEEKTAEGSAKELTRELKSLFEFKPNIFRDIAWGTPVEDCERMILLETERQTKLYERKGDNLKIKDGRLEKISYIFYKNGLMCISIKTKGRLNFEVLKNICFAEFEGWICPDESALEWMNLDFFGATMRGLEYDDLSQQGTLQLVSVKLWGEYKKDSGQVEIPKQKQEWTKIIAWQGSGVKTTEPFEITGSMWRINWENLGSILQVYLYKTSGELVTLPVNTLEKGQDVSYIYEKGEFYLTISAIGRWSIKVEEKT